MGLRLPLYPYYVGRGSSTGRRDRTSPDNARIEARLKELQDYLARDDVKRNAVNVIPIRGKSDTTEGKWVRPVVFDADYENLSGLKALVRKVRDHGTIVIPNITHIIGRRDNDERAGKAVKELMKEIHKRDIEVLSLTFTLKEESRCDLYKEYIQPRKADSNFFRLASRMARATVEYLNHHARCAERPNKNKARPENKTEEAAPKNVISKPIKKILGRQTT